MQSRTLLNIVLLVVVLLLAVFAWTTHRQQTPAETPSLTGLSADEVTRIVIRHNQRRIQLDRTGGGWRMLQPIDIEANSFRVDTLLQMLATASQAAYPVAELELEKYGLAEATTAISFNDVTIAFGTTNPINDYRYIRIGDTVHLIDDHFYPLLSSQTGTLVARELIPADSKIEKLVLPEVTLYRNENAVWQSSTATDSDAISETVRHWKTGQAFGVHNYMPRESLGEISVYLAGKPRPIRFQITDTDPWLIIARPDLDIEYHFQLDFYERLLQPGGSTPH